MNRSQWYVLSIGSVIFGIYLLYMGTPACLISDDFLLVACFIRKYAYAVPGLILLAFGIIFSWIALLEPKKK